MVLGRSRVITRRPSFLDPRCPMHRGKMHRSSFGWMGQRTRGLRGESSKGERSSREDRPPVGGNIPLVRTDSQEDQNFEADDADLTGSSGI